LRARIAMALCSHCVVRERGYLSVLGNPTRCRRFLTLFGRNAGCRIAADCRWG
jgi:hypothetical protein